MTWRVEGQSWTEGERDEEGHRTFTLVTRLIGAVTDGPASALTTPGLPEPGDEWVFRGDTDIWAWCRWDAKVTPIYAKEPNTQCDVTQKFSTKPPSGNKSRCQDTQVEDPLLEPAKVSGSFQNKQVEAYYDRHGFPIHNSAFEMIRGPQNEWDEGYDTIKIEQNMASFFLAATLPTLFKNCVNIAPIFGQDRRCVKLSRASWEHKFWGRCNSYYTRVLEFDLNPLTHDRDFVDEATKVRRGHWDNTTGNWVLDRVAGDYPNAWDPSAYIEFRDRNGGSTKVILNGQGLPAGVRVTGRTSLTPTEPNRESTLAAARAASQSAANLALGMRQFEIYIQTNSISGLPNSPVLVPVSTAVTACNAYEVSANRAVSLSGTASAVSALTDARAASIAAADAVESMKSAVQNHFEAHTELSVGAHAVLQSGRLGANAQACLENSYDALQEANRSSSYATTGTGTTSTSELTTAGSIHIEKYYEADFLLLGIPLDFQVLYG